MEKIAGRGQLFASGKLPNNEECVNAMLKGCASGAMKWLVATALAASKPAIIASAFSRIGGGKIP